MHGAYSTDTQYKKIPTIAFEINSHSSTDKMRQDQTEDEFSQ